MKNFVDKVVLVTGASSGIGMATAYAFKAAGATVIGTGRSWPTDTSWVNTFRAQDLTKPDGPYYLVREVLDAFERLDVLVNAAGALEWGTVHNTDDETWARMLDLNLTVPFEMMRAATHALTASAGAIVNVSSINSYRPFGGVVAYNVAKAGLDQLTRTAAVELAPFGVRVNAVNPGVVITELHKRSGMDDAKYSEFLERSKVTHPLGRPGTPSDVAEAILFLAWHPWLTGVCLPVDGGRHLTVLR